MTLYDLCVKNDIEQVRLALQDTNNTTDISQYLIGIAWHGHIEIAKILIEKRADVSYNDSSALVNACAFGHIKIVKLLLDHNADVHGRFEMPLRWAFTHAYNDIVKLLIQYGADYNTIWNCFEHEMVNYIVIPLLHERLKRYEKDSNTCLLDMRKTLYNILQY